MLEKVKVPNPPPTLDYSVIIKAGTSLGKRDMHIFRVLRLEHVYRSALNGARAAALKMNGVFSERERRRAIYVCMASARREKFGSASEMHIFKPVGRSGTKDAPRTTCSSPSRAKRFSIVRVSCMRVFTVSAMARAHRDRSRCWKLPSFNISLNLVALCCGSV